MNPPEVGDDCFVKCKGRVFRGVVRHVSDPGGPWTPSAQVFTDAAKLYSAQWNHISFYLGTGEGLIDRQARLILPTTLAEWAEYGDLADSQHCEPERPMLPERPRPKPKMALPAQVWLPYKDDEGEAVLPEGFEPGERL